jgi:sec-independent protein translocase protein TatA
MVLAHATLLFFGGLESPTTLIIIFVIVLLMFGGKKIPELMKGLGKGVKEFKDAQNHGTPEDENKPKV